MQLSAKRFLGIGGLALALAVPGLKARAQDAVDPALAAPWAFMQQTMPGVPYSLLKAACAEGTLTFYHSTTTDAAKSQIAAFKKRFPCISVKELELAAGRLDDRFRSESSAKRGFADVTQNTDPGAMVQEAAQGLFAKYTISNDKSYPDAIKESGYWYPVQLVLVGIAWNTDRVTPEQSKMLEDWKGVADPSLAGKAGIVDPTGGGVSLLPWYAWEKLYGDDFIRKIGALKPIVFGGTNPAASSLGSGDISVLINASESGVIGLYLDGAPVRWSLPDPAMGVPLGQAVSALAPHPDAARLYQEYSFTEEGYAAWQKLGGAPTRIGFKDQRKVAQEPWYKFPADFYKYDPVDLNKNMKRVDDFVHTVVGSSQ